jgi:uncharacterized membrane protein
MATPVRPLGRVRDLAVDGLLLALPIGVVLFIVVEVVQRVAIILAPLSHLLPRGRWFGIAALDIVAVIALLLVLIVIGAFARSALGRRLSERMDRIVLRKIPGYLMFKSMAAGFSGEERDVGLLPALVAFDDNTVLGFVVEQSAAPDGLLTVFVPSSPTVAAGNVVLVPRSRVTLLNAPMSAAMHSVSRLGLGMQSLVKPDATKDVK